MKDIQMKEEIRNLRKEKSIAYISSVNEEGYPQTKGMLVLEHEDLRVQYFSTNLGSRRAGQFQKNPKASVYYCDEKDWKGALFTGTMEVCSDHSTKELMWREGFEMYYPKGIEDEDYCVFKFTAEKVNYYYGLSNRDFSIEEV